MSSIKDLEKLSNILDESALKNLDDAAALHLRQSNIVFTVIDLTDDVLSIETEQGKTSGNYAKYRTLISRTHEVFNKYLPSGVKLHVQPREYVESPSQVVTPDWISKQMLEKEVKIKQIAFDTDIDRKDISGWVTGERNMSRIVKAMFYFYFRSL
jgi:hypothetical protein